MKEEVWWYVDRLFLPDEDYYPFRRKALVRPINVWYHSGFTEGIGDVIVEGRLYQKVRFDGRCTSVAPKTVVKHQKHKVVMKMLAS